ncbi:hypothetical protein SAMN05428988_4235 [Chitinophaga sp. YR573]|nr:hypothetical protein SAMN05428988_4235 [Chitinophaga sp. YR573]
MGYRDVIVPLALGLLLIFKGGIFIHPNIGSYKRKRKNIKIAGFILLGIALVYTIITFKTKTCITC